MKNCKILLTLGFMVVATGTSLAAQRSDADQALYQQAVAACSGPRYPSGARPYINYAGGWFRCVEPKDH